MNYSNTAHRYEEAKELYLRSMKRIFFLGGLSFFGIVAVVFLTVGYSSTLSFDDARKLAGSVFFVDSITSEGLKAKYKEASMGNGKIRVLIVPGHDNDAWGTEFRGVREADITALVGEELSRLLSADRHYEPILVRTRDGYAKEFLDYFASEQVAVRAFVTNRRQIMKDLMKGGMVHKTEGGVVHNVALSDVATKLYSINKWANENKVDIVLHLHFNDHPGRAYHKSGRYEGFSMYVPDTQFSNAKASKVIGEALLDQFSKFHTVSNLPVENGGVVEDQELIAIGAFNTLDPASVLIEYGYIYEQRFIDKEIRTLFLKELAFQTHQGLNRFFGKGADIFDPFQTTFLPHQWRDPLTEGIKNNPSVLSLQAALLIEGFYPPGNDLRHCPITGSFGPCTTRAVKAFQETNGIAPATGVAGPITLAKLNEKYSR